jgi:hypothetical protein
MIRLSQTTTASKVGARQHGTKNYHAPRNKAAGFVAWCSGWVEHAFQQLNIWWVIAGLVCCWVMYAGMFVFVSYNETEGGGSIARVNANVKVVQSSNNLRFADTIPTPLLIASNTEGNTQASHSTVIATVARFLRTDPGPTPNLLNGLTIGVPTVPIATTTPTPTSTTIVTASTTITHRKADSDHPIIMNIEYYGADNNAIYRALEAALAKWESERVDRTSSATATTVSPKELKFIHITKTGGTTIEHAGRDHRIQWGMYHTPYGWQHRLFQEVPAVERAKYDWFMVVRNPFDRILSEFHCKWGGVGDKARTTSKTDFNSILRQKIRRTLNATLDGTDIGGHYTAQSRYLMPGVHVLHHEELNSAFEILMKQYTLAPRLDQQARTYQKKRVFFAADFDSQTIDLIQNMYKHDFELFNYSTTFSDCKC